MTIKNGPPCRDCPDRPPDRGCGEKRHTCAKFQAWKAEYRAKKAALNGEAEKDRIINDFRSDGVRKMSRWLGKRGKY